jgi:hypothetical protein
VLDRILIDYAGYAVGVEWHISGSYPLYCAEGSQKMRTYPPPYNGGYATPWCWVDGRNASYQSGGWAGYVSERMLQPTQVRLSITGTYDPGTRAGTVQAVFYNNDTAAAVGKCHMVITEDSINYSAPNGDQWHSHVCRDYLPDQLGTEISIPPGGYDTVVQSFTLQSHWVERFCDVVVYAQDPTVHPDVGYGGFQAGRSRVAQLTGLAEPRVPESFYQNVSARVTPNPMRTAAQFRFVAPAGQTYRLGVYALDGSLVREFAGTALAGETGVNWLRDNSVARGVYAWRLACGSAVASGKLVVTD